MAGAAFDRTDILTFSLREFLHSEACPMSPRTPSQERTSSISSEADVIPTQHTKKPPPEAEVVWVDCFFYGFYADRKEMTAIQDSLPSPR
mmetsp:Transcript_11517/g.26428  ORF Transcript_11517/g.26428 Transcript_11517/m.26428 type:complete len:90 (-) Transcript_11517:503-772(-)